jgi:GNAT superfamily N-acetyltransferase
VIEYRIGKDGLDVDAVIEVYRASRLGALRPIEDRPRMERMMTHANLVVSAWNGALLVGVARSLSDFAFCTYLADLAVRAEFQRQGIGRELIRQTRAVGGEAIVFLFAAPEAVRYYPHLGFRQGSGWSLPSTFPLR